MHLYFRNVNDAFRGLVDAFHESYVEQLEQPLQLQREQSRVGEVLRIPEPVIITYKYPRERVLFNELRDANPFFHLMESLWMLAGRADIAPMNFYSSNYSAQVKDGDNPNAHGAYGKRWRDWFGYDQLVPIIDELKANPGSRRSVLAMWDACCCEEVKDARHDLYMACNGGKDVPCNTHAYFLINQGKLDMTVCNRSNDLVWGALGANVVHFSFLQEYIAQNLGIPVGAYHQVTNNLHVYLERFQAEKWLGDLTPDLYCEAPRPLTIDLVTDPSEFEGELENFNNYILGQDNIATYHNVFREPFFRNVAIPAAYAFVHYKRRNWSTALSYASEIHSDDWRQACTAWLRQRQMNYAKRQAIDNPMAKNELDRRDNDTEMAQ